MQHYLTIARTWKHPRCPQTGDWIKKMWYIHTMEYSSVINRNDSEPVLVRWMKLEAILQSEISQKEKNKYIVMHMTEDEMAGWHH